MRFPPQFRSMVYLEVFGGAASVLFNKRRSQKEILNDFNGDLIHFFRCVREQPEKLIDKLMFVLDSRKDWEDAKMRLAMQEYEDPIQRAADFYQVYCFSYGGGGKTFGANARGMWSRFPLILEACERLQGVIIENRDFEKVFRDYDSPGTFTYLDPPYYGTEGCYHGFLRSDHERLCGLALRAQGQWELSYNNCPEIVELYSQPGIYIEAVERTDNLAQRYEAGKKYSELIITNYDTTELLPKQLSLDQLMDPEEETTEERKILWQG